MIGTHAASVTTSIPLISSLLVITSWGKPKSFKEGFFRLWTSNTFQMRYCLCSPQSPLFWLHRRCGILSFGGWFWYSRCASSTAHFHSRIALNKPWVNYSFCSLEDVCRFINKIFQFHFSDRWLLSFELLNPWLIRKIDLSDGTTTTSPRRDPCMTALRHLFRFSASAKKDRIYRRFFRLRQVPLCVVFFWKHVCQLILDPGFFIPAIIGLMLGKLAS